MLDRRNHHSPWPEADDRLRTLWETRDADGELISILAVSTAMDLSKGSVMGRARRLGLPGRGEPSGRAGLPLAKRKPKQHRAESAMTSIVRTGPATAEVRVEAQGIVQTVQITPDFGRASHLPPAMRKPPKIDAPAPIVAAVKVHLGRVTECAAVLDLGRHGVGTKYCEVPTEPGKSYCTEHCRKYYDGAPKPRMAPDYTRSNVASAIGARTARYMFDE